jgi:hypothetical protein
MTSSPASGSIVEQLDRHLCELPREHGQILVARPFRRHLHRAPNQTQRRAAEADRVRQLRAVISTRRERGDTLDTVERELIVPSGLPEEQQSALWVYAWSHPKRPALSQCHPRLSVWAALGSALLTLVGIYRY